MKKPAENGKKKSLSRTKTYPFNKTKFVKQYEKPSPLIRLTNFALGLRSAFKLLFEPCVNQYNHYPLVFIWGEDYNSDLYSHNAISIIYNVKEKMYYLKIETAMSMASDEIWGNYLLYTFDCFTSFMQQNNLDTYAEIPLFMQEPKIELKAPSIEQLYTYYRMYVNAYLTTFTLFHDDIKNEEEEEYDDEEEDDEGNI